MIPVHMKYRVFKAMFLAVGCMILQPYAYAQQPEDTLALTLQEAQDYAMEHNTQVQNSGIDVKIADKEVWETTARGLPQISASGTYNNNLSLATQLFPNFIEPTIIRTLIEQGVLPPSTPIGEPDLIEVQFGTQHNFTGSISVNQLIFSGPYIVGLQASMVYKGLSRQQHEQSKLETKANVARTYHSILLTQRNIHILENNRDAIEASLRDSKALYQNGMIEQTEVEKIRISLSSLDNTIKTTQRQWEQFKNLLKIQLGVALQKPIKLTQALQEIVAEATLDESLQKEFQVKDNISYQMMRTQVELSKLDLKRQKSAFLPSLSAFYNIRENAMRDKFNPLNSDKKWYESRTLGFELSFPIFNSGQKISRVQQAKLNLEKTKNNLDETRKSLVNSYIQAENNYQTAYEKMQNTRENMALAKKVYNRISRKFAEGMTSSMELTQANREYLNTESNYIQALVDLLNAKTQLQKIRNEL